MQFRKKDKIKEDNIKKKLHKTNYHWNYWKFQFSWNNIEWVDPKKRYFRKN